MDDPEMSLLHTALRASFTGELAFPEDEVSGEVDWSAVKSALAHYGVEEAHDAELIAAVQSEDAATLAEIVNSWHSGERVMLEHDRLVLKRAMKAFRKSLKVTILDAESSLGGGPMSSGRRSTITGIMPPRRYPLSVWDHLVHQKRLAGGQRGIYELPPGG